MNAAHDDFYGALAGWKRSKTPSGATFSLQLAENQVAWAAQDYHRVHITMNDRQLRSFARDLARAAEARGLDLRAK